jgi:hypothetical protein
MRAASRAVQSGEVARLSLPVLSGLISPLLRTRAQHDTRAHHTCVMLVRY